MTLSTLFFGSFTGISTSRMRAVALERVGMKVTRFDSGSLAPHRRLARAAARLTRYTFQTRAMTAAFTASIRSTQPDVVWCEKAVFLNAGTLQVARDHTSALIVHYNPDDPFGTARGIWKTFISAIPEYDVHFVPKPANIPEYQARGACRVIPFDRGFCQVAHSPPSRQHSQWREFAVPVAFTGCYEAERSASLAHLVTSGIPVAIRGALWNLSHEWGLLCSSFRGASVDGEDYALALGAPQITLHFLRHANRDEQDSRTFEIPACGGFMLAEWSPRHAELFEEDVEAVFFRNDKELVEKVRYYLARPEECAAIAARGRSRALRSGYDYESRMCELLTKACRAAGRDDLVSRLPLPRQPEVAAVASTRPTPLS
jgi:spore maturation protein CgeB